ncbi:activity-regulated cytoskeleton associated protein 1-like [Pieris napi]|uniref:activity-regulated cytoskeleton associated protein 1-like n=1 Tax=Pieris napi TaxID=78633 RepID=UPI001FBAAB4C|nr:activity-regulated cytoskeleton associated protein 1-like [Pieris napi]
MQRTSFAKCFSRFSGERDFNVVEEFINTISIFKKIENISDDDAIEGLGLLLTGQASTWWQGVKTEAKTWISAINLLRESFAPKKQPHEIYLELFSTRQGLKESIDTFLCTKRALLSQLPTQRHKEEDQIDLIYGLLNIYLKKHIPRSEIKTFRDLLTKGRHFQSLKNNEEREKLITKRCNYCNKRGHTEDECRKKQYNEKAKNMEKPGVKCYGCGTPGVYRSNCLNCKSKETPPKPVQFYSIINKTIEDGVKIPIIEVTIKNSNGYAYLDSAARTSIAGSTLYELLLKEGYTFTDKEAIINLADVSTKHTKLKVITIEINIDV